MKSILLTSLLFFSLAITPFAFAGGQTGNGGNGCWTRTERGEKEWKSLEEILFPELIKDEAHSRGIKPSLQGGQWDQISVVDMSSGIWPKETFKRLERLKRLAPLTYKALTEFKKLFKVSYVIQRQIDGLFSADISRLFPKCDSYSPALLTLHDGTIIFFKPVWNRLSPLSAEVILIHETIRLAQVFHPAFSSLTDAELQFLTAFLFLNKSHRQFFRVHSILGKIEDSLSNDIQSFPEIPFPQTLPNGFIDTQRAFTSILSQNLIDGFSFGDELNEFRSHHDLYKKSVLHSIRKKYLHGGR